MSVQLHLCRRKSDFCDVRLFTSLPRDDKKPIEFRQKFNQTLLKLFCFLYDEKFVTVYIYINFEFLAMC